MKIIKIATLCLIFLMMSCGAAEDLACDILVKQIEKEYRRSIEDVDNDDTLTAEDKATSISDLIAERDDLIVEAKEDCDIF